LKIKTFIVALLVVMFSLTAVFAFAADPWFILRDKNGVCKVIQAAERTPASIAGPFKTKEAADKVRDKACAAAAKTK